MGKKHEPSVRFCNLEDLKRWAKGYGTTLTDDRAKALIKKWGMAFDKQGRILNEKRRR